MTEENECTPWRVERQDKVFGFTACLPVFKYMCLIPKAKHRNRQWLHSRKQLTNHCSKVAKPLPPTAGENQAETHSRASGEKKKKKRKKPGWKETCLTSPDSPDRRETSEEFTTRQRGFSVLSMASRHFRTGSLLSRLVSALPQAVSFLLADHHLWFHLFLRCSSLPLLWTLSIPFHSCRAMSKLQSGYC